VTGSFFHQAAPATRTATLDIDLTRRAMAH
jgi:hypothetical protein